MGQRTFHCINTKHFFLAWVQIQSVEIPSFSNLQHLKSSEKSFPIAYGKKSTVHGLHLK